MKFGKEFASQMVPEWQEAYMDYKSLKTLLKEIQHFIKQKNKPARRPRYKAFSGLIQKVNSPIAQTSSDHVDHHAITVHNVRRDGNERSDSTFLIATEDGGEKELEFFSGLDVEFNKVFDFYKMKVEEVMEEAAILNKQMEALVAFRVKVENPEEERESQEETTQLASDAAASNAALSAGTPSAARASNEESWGNQQKSDESGDDDKHGTEMKPENEKIEENRQNERRLKRPPPLEILQNVKINTTLETPRSTIKRCLSLRSEKDLDFTKDNLKIAEDKLKKAFVEFYRKLRLLKSYRFLNITAFSKIMKKYDKIVSRNTSRPYMKMIDNSYLGSSEEVSRLMERVESIFINYFTNSNRNKGMNILRPKKRKEGHCLSFSTGFVFGCTVALILALAVIIHARHISKKPGRELYMETMFPLYSLYEFIVLHMLMYAANIYFWRRYRVNYSFIFGFKPGTELGYREVLLLGLCLSVLALASVLANLDMEMDPITHDYKAITELLPLGLLVLVIVIVLCPLNILYRSSRYSLLVCLSHCILAPLYKVTLLDFFLADQLSSQIEGLRSLVFYVCYYGWGDFKRRQSSCQSSHVFNTFTFIVPAIPFWWRFLQSLRRLYDEKDSMQGYNSLKYFSTIVAVCTRTAYNINKEDSWRIIATISAVVMITVSTYWDIVLDWGLLQRNSKNRWLRDKLLISHKGVYFLAMVLNVFLRLAWMQSMMNISIPSFHTKTMIALIASLEIIRRGIWNFFRLENEHLNNVGKFRASKSVPLPFNYDEDEDKDE